MGLLSFFRRRAEKPRGLTVELTSHCGYDCAPCPLNFYTEPVKRQHAPAERLRKVMEELAPLDVVDFTGWGEGLLHPDLMDLVSCAARCSKETTLTTAGSLLSEKLSKGLIGAGLSYLMVSLDCSTPETYRQLKHKDEFGLIVSNVEKFLRLRGKSGKTRLSLSFVVMRENLAEAVSFAELSGKLGADQIVFKTVVPFAREELERSVDSAYYSGLPELASRAREEIAKATQVALAAGVEVARFGDFEKGTRHRCMAYAEERPYLRADGAVAPCCMGAYPVQRVSSSGEARPLAPAVFGNLENSGFGEIWQSPAYEELRRGLRDFSKPLPDLCRDCPICHNFALSVETPVTTSKIRRSPKAPAP
ncbi:MAG: radical SAM protein [Bdellovibrionota bacterium]